MHCPCGSGRDAASCCEPYLEGEARPPTAEALMRSRYVAYVRADMDYLARTLAPESRGDFDARSARRWATEAEWLGLKILSTQAGAAADRTGVVVFAATYRQNGEVIEHRETSQFRRVETGEWRFVKGDVEARLTERRTGAPKIGRNDPCPCGSGKKFKKCCGA